MALPNTGCSVPPADRERHAVLTFLKETQEDVNCPSHASCQFRMENLHRELVKVDESLDNDKKQLKKLVASLQKAVHCGEEHVKSESAVADMMEKLGNCHMPTQPKLGTAFLKFTVILKDMVQAMENQIRDMNNIVLSPLESILKNDLNNNLRKPVEKSYAEYERARSRKDRDLRRQVESGSLSRNDCRPEEAALSMEKERRLFQLATCDYFLKVGEIGQKKSLDLAQHLVDFYQSQCNHARVHEQTSQAMSNWVSEMSKDLAGLKKSRYDEERNELMEMKRVLNARVSPQDLKGVEGKATNPGMKQFGDKRDRERQLGLSKCGFLQKRSDGLCKVWQKRFCSISDGLFMIAHSPRDPPTVSLPLLTCQCKDEVDQAKKSCFTLHSKNRTYVFQAEDMHEKEEWVGVLNNTLEHLFNTQLSQSCDNESHDVGTMKDLINCIVSTIKQLPGNHQCCDCSAPNPPWISTNLGVLVCIECSGLHRELGVQYSRVRSLELDNLCTAELLVAYRMGNYLYNEVAEEALTIKRLSKDASMAERKEFIRAKYVDRKWVRSTSRTTAQRKADLSFAVRSCDLVAILQLQQEGIDLTDSMPGTRNVGNVLHLSLESNGNEALHVLDFIINNGGDVNTVDEAGQTPLHLAVSRNLPQAIKLLLRAEANHGIMDASGQTPLQIALENKLHECVELLELYIMKRKSPRFNQIRVEWGFEGDQNEDLYTDHAASFAQGEAHVQRRLPSLSASNSLDRAAAQPGRMASRSFGPGSAEAHQYHVRPAPSSTCLHSNVKKSSSSSSRPKMPSPPRTPEEEPENLAPVVLACVETLFDCFADNEDEISFKEGERIYVTDDSDADWWAGYIVGEPSRCGLFPYCYVKKV